MLRHRKRDIGVAVGAAALAGFVDATGFLSLGGFFVSFMSGNSTRLAVGIAGIPGEALIAGRLILCFVLGVIAGSLVGAAARKMRRPVVLLLVAALVALGAALAGAAEDMAVLFVAGAMGAENTTFERDGEVSIGLTYMTGTLVKLGQRLAGAIMGGPKLAWAPYALLWLGLVGGALTGASLWPFFGLAGLWIAAVAAVMLAGASWLIVRSEQG
ncbi:MAG: YoaK family protein [Hyphomonadaceae bacterium]